MPCRLMILSGSGMVMQLLQSSRYVMKQTIPVSPHVLSPAQALVFSVQSINTGIPFTPLYPLFPSLLHQETSLHLAMFPDAPSPILITKRFPPLHMLRTGHACQFTSLTILVQVEKLPCPVFVSFLSFLCLQENKNTPGSKWASPSI